MADILALSKKQKKDITRIDERNLSALIDAYGLMYDNLQGDIDALVKAIEKLENPTKTQVERLPEYKRMMRRAENELDRFTTYLETSIGAASMAAIGLGLSHSRQLVTAATGQSTAGITPSVMRPLLSFLDREGPLYARLQELTGATVDKVVQSIIDGVGSGFNPRKIASAIQDAFGGGLTDALRNMRTVQIWSYRESARANYTASGFVTGWIWYAELDADTCMSCTAQHGTVHGLDETLDGHYNCRCTPLPYIEGFDSPVTQTGQEWFDGLSAEQQRAMMGNSKHEAYTSGGFEFGQLSKQVPNEVYTTMRVETPLKDLVKDE